MMPNTILKTNTRYSVKTAQEKQGKKTKKTTTHTETEYSTEIEQKMELK